MYDLVLKNGKIVDGTGNPWYIGDVGIQGDKIGKIGVIPLEEPAPLLMPEGWSYPLVLSIPTATPTLSCR